jgi:hypothetical protein
MVEDTTQNKPIFAYLQVKRITFLWGNTLVLESQHVALD